MAIDGIQQSVSAAPPAGSPVGGNSTAEHQSQGFRSQRSESQRAVSPTTAPIEPASVELPDLRIELESIARVLRDQQRNLSFSVDEGTGKTVVRVVRESTGEVVRQIPSEEVLAIAATLRRGEALTSLGIDERS